MVSASGRRGQVLHAHKRGVSLRRACALYRVTRSALRYESKREKADVPVLAQVRAMAARYPSNGYRLVREFLKRDGLSLSAKRTYRLWRAAKLQLPRKRARKRVATSRPRPTPPTTYNHVWAIDFVFDACADGRQIKCLTVIDEWTRECLAIDVAGSLRSRRVVEVLAALVSTRGAPRFLRADNGPEFVSRALVTWMADENIETAFTDPGKPWQNGVNESFNGTFRNECLGREWFRNRTEAAAVIAAWRAHYNDKRPHSSLRYLTPRNLTTKMRPRVSEFSESKRLKEGESRAC